jgi:hypothetical protein
MANISTFWQAINQYKIVIPQIQRDYAQGRVDADSSEVRNNIIKNFYKSIARENPPIDIDFIYGYIQNNEFIPLDGQQRLTTLFLIHWYLGKQAKADINCLSNFRYETRQSSTDFCRAILREVIDLRESDLAKYIIDQRWFYYTWQKDPTIQAMLTMLQAIHLTFKDENHKDLWGNLKSAENPPITFNFLKLDDFGLNDNLYVKMNSRGKPLTRFENFKVWFQKQNPNNKDWQSKIDNEWTNLFWNYKDAYNTGKLLDNDTIDNEFMQFINGMVMFDFAIKKNEVEAKYFYENHEIALSKYEEIECFADTDEKIQLISQTLDWFHLYDENLNKILKGIDFWKEKTVFRLFISNNPTYQDRAFFYAYVHYIQYCQHNVNEDSLRRWIRVSRNLIENTNVDSLNTFISAINSIQQIGNECLDIYNFLNRADSKISFFLQAQVEEEKIKASLILQGSTWENELIEAENHPLFRGNISFLLPNKTNEDINTFKKHREIAKKLFNKDGSNYKSDYLLIRATLAESTVNEDVRLLDNGENWRALLKDKVFQTSISNILITLERQNNYEDALNQIIKDYQDTSICWKYYLVKNKILLDSDASRSKIIKRYYWDNCYYLFNNEGANWINNDNQFLLSNLRNELITEVLKRNTSLKLYYTDSWWVKQDKDTKQYFYRGQHIWLKKEIGNYNLWVQFTQDKVVVGFLQNDADKIKIKENNNLPQPNGWLVAKYSENYPENSNQFSNWIDNLLQDISTIENLASSKN